MREGLAELFERSAAGSGQGAAEAEIQALHAKIGQLVVERNFLKQRSVAEAQTAPGPSAAGVARAEPEPAMPPAGVSRSSWNYRPREADAATLALQQRIDELYLQHPFYGSGQMSRHLPREGLIAGRQRVRRLMRRMGLEAI